MKYKFEETRQNSDATSNYNVVGKYPVKFIDFFEWVLKNESSFRVEFGATNDCYGGWLGNRIEMYKIRDKDIWRWTKQEPKEWFEEIMNKNVTACVANGGWGQMLYLCTFE